MSHFDVEAFRREMLKLADQNLVSRKLIAQAHLAEDTQFYEKLAEAVEGVHEEMVFVKETTAARLRRKPPLEKRHG